MAQEAEERPGFRLGFHLGDRSCEIVVSATPWTVRRSVVLLQHKRNPKAFCFDFRLKHISSMPVRRSPRATRQRHGQRCTARDVSYHPSLPPPSSRSKISRSKIPKMWLLIQQKGEAVGFIASGNSSLLQNKSWASSGAPLKSKDSCAGIDVYG